MFSFLSDGREFTIDVRHIFIELAQFLCRVGSFLLKFRLICPYELLLEVTLELQLNFINQRSQLVEDVFNQITSLSVDFRVSGVRVAYGCTSDVSVLSLERVCLHQ